MRPNKAEIDSLIRLLTSMVEEIRIMEMEFGLRASERDMRPRIEYFHDAVRAFSSGDKAAIGPGGRLSVEYLAYDLSWLRHIQSNPVAVMKGARALSPQTGLVVHGQIPPGEHRRPDRQMRTELSERYKNYTVIYAALFAEAADRDYKSRLEDHNNAVEDMAQVEKLVEMLAKGQVQMEELEHAVELIDDDDLRQKIALLMHDKTMRKRLEAQEFSKKLKEFMTEHDKKIAIIEKAHFAYCASQLAAYEDSKDVVKKMAMQGLNLAGKFLAGAVQDMGRGGGRER